jgi:hypothetical protein
MNISYNTLGNIIKKQYTISELSSFDKFINQSLSGNLGSFSTDFTNNLLDNFSKNVLGLKNQEKIINNDEKNLYNYTENIATRLKRLIKESLI